MIEDETEIFEIYSSLGFDEHEAKELTKLHIEIQRRNKA